MPQRINLDVVKALGTVPVVTEQTITFPAGSDMAIYLNGVSATDVLRLAVATQSGGAPLWTARGTGGLVNVYSYDIKRLVPSGVAHSYSISIEDAGSFGITTKSSTFLAKGQFIISPIVTPNVTAFDEAFIEGATLSVVKLTQAEYDSLAEKEAGRPYLVYDLTAEPPYMQDGAFPIMRVYVGTVLRYNHADYVPPEPGTGGGTGDGTSDPTTQW